MSLLRTLGLSTGSLDEVHSSPRTVTVSYLEQPGGDPIVGLVFQTDYDTAQEYGVADLRKVFTGQDPRRFQMVGAAQSHWAEFSDVNGFVLSVRPVGEKKVGWGSSAQYGQVWQDDWLWSRRGRFDAQLAYKSVADLRGVAKGLGVSPLPRRKADLVSAIVQRQVGADREALQWPAVFHGGRSLIVRADVGPAAAVVKRLVGALRRGTLAIGSASGPFHTGMFLYDAAEETDGLRAEREAQFDWHDAQMARLDPVQQGLEDDGFGFYFLGNPSVLDTGDGAGSQVRFWMNSSTVDLGDGRRGQVYGWFTLEQLEDRSFVELFCAKR